jgi:membrane protease YdiL (CAAX protease family)
MNKLAVRLILLGLIATSSMLLVPLEQLVPVEAEPLAVRLLAIIQPAVLVIAAAFLGAWAAPKVGLDAPAVRAWAERRPIWPVLRAQAPLAAAAGAITGLVLIGFWTVISRAGVSDDLSALEMPLVTKLLYGGIVEELLLRWGVMSLLVWAAWRVTRAATPVRAWCYWVGALAAALLFAAGHLPALYLLLPGPPSWLVGLVLAANLLPGLLFGLLFWRRGLEAAMLAHALAHLFATAALSVL